LEYAHPVADLNDAEDVRKDPLPKTGEVAIVVDEVWKRYGDADVVKGISFSVPKGCCFGILGPNGAGKTSLLGMIEGITPITAGKIEVMGMDVATEIRKIQPRFGVQLQHSDYFRFLTVSELIAFYAELRAAVSRKPRLPHPEKLLDRLDLRDKMKFKVEELSGGQKQRLSIVLALIGDPEIIFLDEPTAALDPHSRRYTWEFIEELKRDRSRTIVMTTHYMEEAERLCDEIMIMNRGEIVGRGDPSSLIAELSAAQQVKIKLDIDSPGEPIALAIGQRFRTVWDAFTCTLMIETDDVAAAVREAIAKVEGVGGRIVGIQMDRLSLEDVFLSKTDKELKP
jgi:ABC-2 type transport system ATP-binding protein